MDLIPKRIMCCQKKRRQRGLEKARNRLAREINIIDIIKSRRLVHRALRMLITKSQRVKLQERARYLEIDPGSGSSGNDKKLERGKSVDHFIWTDDSLQSDSGNDDQQPAADGESGDFPGSAIDQRPFERHKTQIPSSSK